MSFTPRLHLVRTHIITVRCSVITASLSFILSNYPHIITAKIVLYYSDIITVKHIIWRSKSRFCLGTGTKLWRIKPVNEILIVVDTILGPNFKHLQSNVLTPVVFFPIMWSEDQFQKLVSLYLIHLHARFWLLPSFYPRYQLIPT